MFETSSPEAENIILLWWVLLGIATFVFVLVTVFALVGYVRNRNGHADLPAEATLGRWFFVAIGATVFLLLAILIATLNYSQTYSDHEDTPVTIEVIGKQWWWEVIYLANDGSPLFETANEIVIPAGVPVRIRLLAQGVIHSFWVPSLGGKIDMIPGRKNHLVLQASEPGVYRGQCAEFCGMQHANMAFSVIAKPIDDYKEWMARERQPARTPTDEVARLGKEVFVSAGCADCHSIRGVTALSDFGPDLTHLARRKRLAAGTVPNTKGHLAAWTADPQGMKPGSFMPATRIPSEEFIALLHYLEMLE